MSWVLIALLVVPLVDQQGTLGSLVVLRRASGAFEGSLTGLMRTFANQAVLAMRNARLFTEVDHKSHALETANETVRAQADRRRVGPPISQRSCPSPSLKR